MPVVSSIWKAVLGYIMQRKRKTLRASGKFYVFLGIMAALAAGLVLFYLKPGTAVAEEDSVDFTAVMPVVVVRDEEVVASESYGKAEYLVPDQQRVESGTPVVNVYRWGYNEKVMDDLVDVRTKIMQYEENNQTASATELASINDRILEKTRELRDSSDEHASAGSDAVAIEGELRELINNRIAYLRESVSSDQQLGEYRKQEQQLEERVGSWRDVWKTSDAGVVSYYFDGYEPVLNADTIRTASPAQVRQILDGTLPIAQIADGTEPLYRLVNNFQWYVVIPSETPVLEFANDNTFSVTFSDYADRKFEGTIIGHITEGNDHLYVMEFSEDIGALVNTRRAEATFSATFSGLSVPRDAVRSSDNVTGVYVVEGKSREFVPVTVSAEDGDRLVIEPDEPSSPLVDGARVDV